MSSSSAAAEATHDSRQRFRLTDPPDANAMASRRREIKFALPSGDAPMLRSVLELNCRRVEHGGSFSRVRSIYFDDFHMSAYSESVDGVGNRAKARLRWYGDNERRLFFEVKRRLGQIMEKVRVPLASELDFTELHYPAIHRELCAVLPKALAETFMLYTEPSLIVSYKREYYEAIDSPLRVTLDSDIQCFDQSGLGRPRMSFGQPLAGLVILEGKTPVRLDHLLPRLLCPLRPVVTRSSKYVMACDALGLVR